MASLSDQPRSDLRMLVGRVVVDYEVHIKICGHRTVDVIQKGDEFLMPMTRALFRNDFARRGIGAAIGLAAGIRIPSASSAITTGFRRGGR